MSKLYIRYICHKIITMSLYKMLGFTQKNNKSQRKTRKNTVKKTPMICSPAIKDKAVTSDTCFTANILTKIKSDYNHTNRADPIRETDPKKILRELRQRLSHCGKEDCWLRQIKDDTLRKKINDYVFAPKSPSEWNYNPNEWLSNLDIFNVLTQYEDKYPHFEFIGPSFIDFDKKVGADQSSCVTDELCNFSLKQHMEKKHSKIAVVFNLDKHTGPGTHWVSLFVDIKDRFIFYFDSAGSKIPNEIMALVKRIQKQGLELSRKIRFKFYENYPMAHQYSTTECGMYSLFFIITMLLNKVDHHDEIDQQSVRRTRGGKFNRIHFFKKIRVPDSHVEKLRNKYFNK